jgi:hypothetical protein
LILRVLGVFALLLLPALAGADGAPARHALLVGANQAGPGAGPLYYAEADARRLGDVLDQLGDVPRARSRVLLSPTVGQLRAALAALAADVARSRADGAGHVTVLFYYSGHAEPDALRLGPATLPYSELKQGLADTGADVRVLLLDSCHAGGATRSKGASRAPGFLRDTSAAADARGEGVITSSAADEASQESDEVGGSYFTHYLISGLRGDADATGDGEVTLEEAYRYVFHRTVTHTAGTRAGAQHPGFDYDLSGSGALVLTRLAARGAALRFDGSIAGRFLVFDEERGEFVAEVQAIAGRPTRLLVQRGRYRVQLREPEALYEQRLSLQDGGEGLVERAAMRSLPYSEDTTKGAIARTRRVASGREVVLAVKGGGQGFFDPSVVRSLIPPMPLSGLELEVRGVLGPMGSLRAEALLGGRRLQAEVAPGVLLDASYLSVVAGIGPTFTPRVPGAPWLRPFVGVRLGLIWVHRDLLPVGVQAPQDYVMVTPGVTGGLGLALAPRFGLAIEGRAHGTLFVADGKQQVLGYGEALGSLWFRL